MKADIRSHLKKPFALALVAACAQGLVAAERPASPVKLSQAVDFLDNAYFTHDPSGYYTKTELRKDVEQAKANGFRKIYFRGTGGTSYHESKVRPMFKGEHRWDWAKKLVKTINEYDVVAEYVKVCHELGMELYYWIPIFDNGGAFARNYPGMADYEKWGPNSSADPNLKTEHMLAHRFADRPREPPKRPIATIRMRIGGKEMPETITDKELLLYVGDYDQPFRRYTKPFKVTLEQGGYGKVMTISGLEIDKPVVKFASDTFTVSTGTTSADDLRAYYADGEELTMYRTLEAMVWGDRDREHLQWGMGGQGVAWGKSGKTLIARFGDFERHALGVPEFAYPECRQRLVNIVKEVFDRYPEMDGITFSIRTHSLPACGFKEELGYGNLFYGFSEPVAKEYERRYGADPRKAPYDEKKFWKLRGEYVTQMLDEVGLVVHERGGRLEMMAPVRTSVYEGGRHVNSSLGSMFPWWVRADIDDMFDIATWAKRGSVDMVLMVGTQYQQERWTPAWTDEVARFKAKLAGTRTKLGVHYLVNGARETDMAGTLPGLFADANVDEVEFYEQHHMSAAYPYMYPATLKALEKSGRPLEKLETKGASDVYVTVDFLDECGMAAHQPFMAEKDIREMVVKYRNAGVKGLVWRVASLGIAGYLTDRMTQITNATEIDRSHMQKRKNDFSKHFLWPEPYMKTWERTMKETDVYTTVVRVCHEEGLELYFWVDLFDEMYGKFLSAHPECLVQTKDGANFPGLRDYANPTAVREKLDEIAELYRYRPDGLYLSSSCHARHLNFPEPDGAFGTLPAAKFTEFLRALKSECSPHGIKLMVMAPFGGSLNFCSPYFSNHVKYRVETDWKTWIDEGIADSLILADYCLQWRQDGIWASKGLKDARPGHYGFDVFAPEFVDYNRGRAKLYFFNGLELKTHPAAIARSTYEVRKFGLDGQLVHESMLMENNPADVEALKESRRRMQVREVRP